nr:MAG TPA: hypothetical protein [Caudoviricetes sp.]
MCVVGWTVERGARAGDLRTCLGFGGFPTLSLLGNSS